MSNKDGLVIWPLLFLNFLDRALVNELATEYAAACKQQQAAHGHSALNVLSEMARSLQRSAIPSSITNQSQSTPYIHVPCLVRLMHLEEERCV